MARLVLIEDNDELRRFLAEALAEEGHEVVQAANGRDGLLAVRKASPELVISDIDMPMLSGHGVLEALRGDPEFEWLPFVFLTGWDKPEDRRAGMRSGADDYLTKPVDPRDLLDTVRARLARREAARRETERRLDELRRSVTTLLPHEMRTPLTALLGSLDVLQSVHRDIPAEQVARLVDMALSGARRLHRAAENYLLQATLDLDRLAGRGSESRPFSGSAGALDVEAAASTIASQHERSGDLRLELSDAVVPIGGPYLRKIVSELVDNAFKFSAGGQPALVSLAQSPGEVWLEVADAGPGLSEGQAAEIGAFRQFGRSLLEQQGSGLGLGLVLAMAAASGGAVEFGRSPLRGAAVRVRWPRSVAAASPSC